MILLQQLLPLLRFDGYYVLSDLTGVPDILSRIKPIFRSIIRPRDPQPAVLELKPWVRVVVTGYLVALVPALAFLVVFLVIGTPRMLATTYDSLGLQLDRMRAASGADEMALGGFQIVSLLLPVAAMSSASAAPASARAAGCSGGRAAARTRRRGGDGHGRGARRGDVRVVAERRLRAIRPGERGTIGEAVRSLPKAVEGRPSFTPERAAEYAPVPTVREQRSPAGATQGVAPRRQRKGEVREPEADGAPRSEPTRPTGPRAVEPQRPRGARLGARGVGPREQRGDRHAHPDRDTDADTGGHRPRRPRRPRRRRPPRRQHRRRTPARASASPSARLQLNGVEMAIAARGSGLRRRQRRSARPGSVSPLSGGSVASAVGVASGVGVLSGRASSSSDPSSGRWASSSSRGRRIGSKPVANTSVTSLRSRLVSAITSSTEPPDRSRSRNAFAIAASRRRASSVRRKPSRSPRTSWYASATVTQVGSSH